ncbi:glycoside hydrolase family 35 protein [Nonomuraea typhae]|uniref:glycoside hydrolase family 35 protein n=1 Tax=Nonomuraea typhae TaxID=2603600 RepID=UPI0012F76941|nr:beta-galactosidase family protein [Nonomuraea typhae]
MKVLSGAMHYFRTLPEQWPDRLGKLRAMGVDTVETYVPWNLHEPHPGTFVFTGLADMEGFFRAAGEAGLQVIVRPGPYICAEWENGGLPAWLPGPLRCHDPRFLEPVDRFFDEVIPRIAAHQATRGGNVVMVQVENEYGSYGTDPVYLRHLADGLVRRGIEVPLFTSDGATDLMLTGGTLPGVLATANFGSGAERQFGVLARHRPQDEPFCMEFWNGWFDHFGEPHHTRDPQDAARALEEILERGSVNFYMGVGGTSFGFFAGANTDDEGVYQPTVTSYDYDAPISESGELTPKFWAYREVLGRYAELPPVPESTTTRLPEQRVELGGRLALLDCLDVLSTGTVRAAATRTFEELGQDYGLAVYRTRIPGPREDALEVSVRGLRDRANVLVDGVVAGVLERDGASGVAVKTPAGGAELTLVVEAMGRVNYGPLTGERKGILDGVRHERQYLFGWEIDPVPLADVSCLPWDRATTAQGPAFYRGTLHVVRPADGFLALPGWVKGHVWVNGFHLGRYWDKGPQVTLYVPWPLLREGANEIVVLEMDGAPAHASVELRGEPQL